MYSIFNNKDYISCMKDIYLYDTNFNLIGILDGVWESCIWTDRYNEPSDFEILLPLESKINKLIQRNYYLEKSDSEKTMIIESRQIESSDDGKHVKITGRSLESILDRRIIWVSHEYKASDNISICDIVETLLNENAINPVGIAGDSTDAEKRKLPITFDKNSLPDKIKNYKIYEDVNYYDDDLLSFIQNICQDKKFNLGFKIVRDKSTNLFNFSLYKGKDLSYNNTEGNKAVCFSPNMDNLLSSTYLESDAPLKNITRIEDGNGENSILAYYPSTPDDRPSGLNRRETTTSPSSNYEEGTSESKKIAFLQTKGKEDLMDKNIEKTFEGEITDNVFVCGVDYNVGDVVQFENEFGDRDKARIIEIIFSSENDGYKMYPTLESTMNEREQS